MRLSPVLLLAAITPAAAQAPLSLRAEVDPAGPAWFGQHLAVTLIARTPVRFAGPLDFPDLSLSSRAVVVPGGSTPGVEREGGTTYAVIQHRYDVFPAEAGRLIVSGIKLSARVVAEDGQVRDVEARSEALPIEVRLPQGSADPARLVTAPDLRLQTDAPTAPLQFHVGDPVTLTATLTARDTTAMLLPPMSWTAPDGIRAYPDPPALQDGNARGVLSATRIDRITFVPQRPGRYLLAGPSLQWFEPGSRSLRSLSAPSLTVIAAVAAPARRTATPWIAAASVLLLLALWAALRLRRRRFQNDEAAAYSALLAACRADEPKAALSALLRWIPLATRTGLPRTTAALAAEADTPALAAEACDLAARVCGRAPRIVDWAGAGLQAAARTARRTLHRPRRQRRASELPELNPHQGMSHNSGTVSVQSAKVR